MPYILALNCGSSTLKYQVFDADAKTPVLSGNVEKIGEGDSFITQKYPDGAKVKKETDIKNHSEALNLVMFMLREASIDLTEIIAVGHRVVHGGEKLRNSVEITDEVIKIIDDMSVLSPLHNPSQLIGIIIAKQLLPNARQVAVFDTAFFSTMPDYVYRYAVPAAWYRDMGVRKYGKHGTSHLYVSKRAAKMMGRPVSELNMITLHIGSGATAAAIRHGNAMDVSMGMTVLAGLTMGTRPGDLDPGAVLYVMKQLGLSPDQMQARLTRESGLIGVTECFNDHRDIETSKDNGNDACRLALEMEINNLKRYIGGYMAELGHVDAIVFTAGVGENDDIIRAGALAGLEEFGIKLNTELNKKTFVFKGAGETDLSAPDSKIKIFMIPTNEELVIVEDTIAIANGTYNPNHLKMKYSFA